MLNGIFEIASVPSLLCLDAPEPLKSLARQPGPRGGARKGGAQGWAVKRPFPQSGWLPRELSGDPV